MIFFSGEIGEPSDYELIGSLGRIAKKENCLLILTTYGGIADSAYRMMRHLQTRYAQGRITAFVPHICKSAGTLMVVGADEIVMSGVAELGPLDVQVLKPDELGERTSGLTPMQALSALRAEAFNCFEQHFLLLRERSGRQITSKTAADIAVRLTTGWFQPLYEQVDPMRLGETMRAMSIARDYGMRLARGNIDLDSLEDLISKYPQHGFIIDREEATSMFKRVRPPGAEESELAHALTASKLIDDGLNGGHAIVRVISEEECCFSSECEWEGIEYEEDPKKEHQGKGASGGSGNGAADGERHAKPIRPATTNGKARKAKGGQKRLGGNGGD